MSEAGAPSQEAAPARLSRLDKVRERLSRGVKRRSVKRPRIYVEVLFVFIFYRVYSYVRAQVPDARFEALDRARDILHLEQVLFLDVERGLNQEFVEHGWLGALANSHYASLHFLFTIGVLVWLYAWHPVEYVQCRRVLMATTLVGLAGFWLYPLAPPRMLAGYTNTADIHASWGFYDTATSTAVEGITNQYAAMPSLHTGWSLWCALAVITVHRSWKVAILAVLYPLSTVIVIMGTANHFILDAVGGAVALALGYLVVQALSRSREPALRLVRVATG